MPTPYMRGLVSMFCLALAAVPALAADQRGVTDTEIVIGTITDLSGVTAIQGVNNSNAIRMAFDEVNAKGGINGRKIKLHRGGQPVHRAACGAGDEQAAEQRRRFHDAG